MLRIFLGVFFGGNTKNQVQLLGEESDEMAIMTQQKVFGEYLCKRFVSARAFVKINSTTMRAVKKILERPGMDIAKVVSRMRPIQICGRSRLHSSSTLVCTHVPFTFSVTHPQRSASLTPL